MSQFVEGPTRTFRASAAIGRYLRVKMTAGKVALAGVGATDEPAELGTMEMAAFAADELVSVRLRNAPGTVKMVASGAITQGAAVFGAAAGKISASTSGAAIGRALEAASADGDVIEVLRF
ncbi:MAG: capsid cement protein [Phycisphaerae bacterium]